MSGTSSVRNWPSACSSCDRGRSDPGNHRRSSGADAEKTSFRRPGDSLHQQSRPAWGAGKGRSLARYLLTCEPLQTARVVLGNARSSARQWKSSKTPNPENPNQKYHLLIRNPKLERFLLSILNLKRKLGFFLTLAPRSPYTFQVKISSFQ